MQVNGGGIFKESDLINKFSAVVGIEDHWGRKDAEDELQLLGRFNGSLSLARKDNAKLCQVIFIDHDPLELAVRVALHIDIVNLQVDIEKKDDCHKKNAENN